MEKYICFRFDVDTHVCLTKGAPNLLQLFKAYDARCTFFVSMGTAFNRWLFIKEKLKFKFFSANPGRGFFSMVDKLGFINSVVGIVFNLRIGSRNKAMLHNIIGDRHEIGLHGGRNHASWQRGAINWNEQKIHNEILYGLKCFQQLRLPKPISFAPPCWQSPKHLDRVLVNNGFLILGDEFNMNGSPYRTMDGLIRYPANVIGKNGNIGFIENLRALGHTSDEILSEFERQLDMEGKHKMVFDHPFYVGVKEIELLSRMLQLSIDKGYKIESLQNICRGL